MKISTLFYTIRQGFVNIFRNKWYSLASVATIAACLFLFGLFYAVLMNFRSIVLKAEEGVSVTVFFHSEYDLCKDKPHGEGVVPADERLEEIGQMIAGRAEVSDVRFISDDEAWEKMLTQDLGEAEDIEEVVSSYLRNPLEGDDSYEVFLSDVSMQNALVTWLKSFPEVRKVNASILTADILSGANLLIAYISVGIIVILLAVSIFLISNTVAVGISVRSEEINIMKYVGATDFFVRSPFVVEGMLIGLMGAALPLWMIYGIYQYLLTYILERFTVLGGLLNFLPAEELFKVLTPISVGVGVGIGFLGSISSVKKHLQV